MKLNSFLMLATIVAAVFGLAFLVAPSQLVALYGVKLTPATEVIGRIAGSVILGFAIVFWGARNGSGAEAFKAVMMAGLIANGLDAPDPAARDRHRSSQRARLAAGPDQRRAGDRVLVFCLRQGQEHLVAVTRMRCHARA